MYFLVGLGSLATTGQVEMDFSPVILMGKMDIALELEGRFSPILLLIKSRGGVY